MVINVLERGSWAGVLSEELPSLPLSAREEPPSSLRVLRLRARCLPELAGAAGRADAACVPLAEASVLMRTGVHLSSRENRLSRTELARMIFGAPRSFLASSSADLTAGDE